MKRIDSTKVSCGLSVGSPSAQQGKTDHVDKVFTPLSGHDATLGTHAHSRESKKRGEKSRIQSDEGEIGG